MAVTEKCICIQGAPERDDAAAWIDAIAERPQLRVAALVETPAGGPPTRSDCPVFADVAGLLSSQRAPDLSLLLGAPATRFDAAEQLLRAGSDLLVAGPLATTTRDADRLTELAERLGRVIVCRGLLASPGVVRAVRQALAEGSLGAVEGLEIDLGHKRDARRAWQGEPELSGGGVWMDLGPGALEFAEALLGPARRLRMHSAAQRQGGEVEDEALVEVEHRSGAHSRIRLSWNEERGGALARLRAERASITIGPLRALLRDATGEARPIGAGFDPRQAAGAALDDVLERRLYDDAICDEGCESLERIHAAYRSLAQERWQTV